MISVISPVDEGAIVYHNGFYICGISFVPDPDLESKFDKIIIPTELGADFVNEKLNHNKWFVWNGKLYNNQISQIEDALELSIIDDKYVLIEDNNKANNLWMTIKMHPGTQHVIFSMTQLIMNFKYSEEYLTFVFTEKNDPTIVLYVLDIPTKELFENQEYDVVLPIEPDKKVDLYTKRLFPNYGIEYPKIIISDDGEETWENKEVVLSLPKNHFVNLQCFKREPVIRGLQASLDRFENTMTFALKGENIEAYKQSKTFLPVLFSMLGDPSLLLHTKTMLLEELQKKPIEIPLPNVLNGDFDVWSPMVYKNCGFIEIKYEKFNTETIEYVGTNLQAVIDRKNKTVNFSLIGDKSVDSFSLEKKFIRVLFSLNGKIVHHEMVPTSELKNGLVTYMLKSNLIEKQFDLMVKPELFRKAYLVEI